LGLAVSEGLGTGWSIRGCKRYKVPLPLSANYDSKSLIPFNPGGYPLQPRGSLFNPAFPITTIRLHQRSRLLTSGQLFFSDFWLFSVSPHLCGELLPFRCRRFRPHPPFFTFCCKQTLCSNQLNHGPCMELGWPLGHAWATQGPPKPRPNPNQAEGRSVMNDARRTNGRASNRHAETSGVTGSEGSRLA
jgi:hypothetical protein